VAKFQRWEGCGRSSRPWACCSRNAAGDRTKIAMMRAVRSDGRWRSEAAISPPSSMGWRWRRCRSARSQFGSVAAPNLRSSGRSGSDGKAAGLRRARPRRMWTAAARGTARGGFTISMRMQCHVTGRSVYGADRRLLRRSGGAPSGGAPGPERGRFGRRRGLGLWRRGDLSKVGRAPNFKRLESMWQSDPVRPSDPQPWWPGITPSRPSLWPGPCDNSEQCPGWKPYGADDGLLQEVAPRRETGPIAVREHNFRP